jgi:head-tail adaptor
LHTNSWPRADPGTFRHVITLLEPTPGTDSFGGITTYSPAVPPVIVYAAIDFLRGEEIVRQGLDVSQIYLKVTSWFRSEFSTKKRILAPDGSQYIIVSPDNAHLMNVTMELTCQQITDATTTP